MEERPQLESTLTGKPANFHKAVCRDTKFDSIANSTNAILPKKSQLTPASKDSEKKLSLLTRLFAIIRK